MSWSPAHKAVELEDLPRLRELLDAGDGDGWTLLRHAIDIEYDGHVQSTGPHSRFRASTAPTGRGGEDFRRNVTLCGEAVKVWSPEFECAENPPGLPAR